MKTTLSFVSLILLITACGSDHELNLQQGYSTQTNLTASDTVELTYQESYNHRFISVGSDQAKACNDFANDYQNTTAIPLDSSTLKVKFASPEKHCTKRNALKQCEGIRYVFTFHCQYQIKK